jgi:transposase
LSRCFWPIGEAAQADYGFSSAWLVNLLERKPRKLAAVALANKMARIIWAMMARGEAYRRQLVTTA